MSQEFFEERILFMLFSFWGGTHRVPFLLNLASVFCPVPCVVEGGSSSEAASLVSDRKLLDVRTEGFSMLL